MILLLRTTGAKSNRCRTVHVFSCSQGKSLSVICSALQWLKDAEAKDVDGKCISTPDNDPSATKRKGARVNS